MRQGYVSAPALEPNGPSRAVSPPPIARLVTPPRPDEDPPPSPPSRLPRSAAAVELRESKDNKQKHKTSVRALDEATNELTFGEAFELCVTPAGSPAATPPRIREPSSLPLSLCSPRPSSLDRSLLTRPLPPPRLVPPLPSARASASCPRS